MLSESDEPASAGCNDDPAGAVTTACDAATTSRAWGRGVIRSALRVRDKLFTSNDPRHVHAALGAACFAHIVYRCSRAWGVIVANGWAWDTPDLFGFGRGAADSWLYAWLLLHVALSATSFLMHVPAQRHADGTRIWRQFRAQQAVFVLRAAANMVLVRVDQTLALLAPLRLRFDLSRGATAVVFASLLGTDAVDSALEPHERTPTVRGARTQAAGKALAAFMQFLATARALLGLHALDGYFTGLALLQLTSFMMTLQRKGLLSHGCTLALYALQLLALLAVYAQEVVRELGGLGLAFWIASAAGAMALRTRAGASKYATWTLAVAWTQAALPSLRAWAALRSS